MASPRIQEHGHGGIPVWMAFFGLLAAFMLLFSGIFCLNAWKENSELTLAMAQRIFLIASRNARNKLDERFLRLSALVDLGANLGSREENPSASSLMRPFFLRTLVNNPSVLALNQGTSEGEFFSIIVVRNEAMRMTYEAPEGTAYIVWTVSKQEGGGFLEVQECRDPSFELLERQELPARYNVRTRPWYRAAMETPGRVLTDPYIFTAARKPGVTYARAAADGKSVFSVNILLADFNEVLATVPVSQHGQALLVSGGQRVLAQGGRGGAPWIGAATATRLSEHPDSMVRRAAAVLDKEGWEGERFHALDSGLFVHCSELVLGSKKLNLLMVAPRSDFRSVPDRFFQASLLFCLALLLFFLPLAFLVSWRLTRSLNLVGDEAEGMEEAHAARPSHLREVRRLSLALATLKNTLADRTRRLVELRERMSTTGEPSRRSAEEASRAAEALEVPAAWDQRRRQAGFPGTRQRTPVRNDRSYLSHLPHPSELDVGPDPGSDPPDSAGAPAKRKAFPPAGGPEEKKDEKVRILLAESDAVNRQVVLDLLRNMDMAVDLAEDGLEAVEKAWTGRYAMLFAAEDLPGIGGGRLAGLLRMNPELSFLPVVMMDAAPPEGKDKETDASQPWLLRPVRPDMLRVTLKHALASARSAEA